LIGGSGTGIRANDRGEVHVKSIGFEHESIQSDQKPLRAAAIRKNCRTTLTACPLAVSPSYFRIIRVPLSSSGFEPGVWENSMFIETEVTPNPATLKFLPGRPVLTQGTLDIRDGEGAEQSPLAQALFSIDGVSGVFFGSDFISVTKSGGDWPALKPVVLGVIMEHFVSGEPLLIGACDGAAEGDGEEFFAGDDAETVATIKKLIETHVRPAVANDGGDINFRGFRDGTVYLALKGSCSGCPSSSATLRHGIENLLKHYVPEVRAVEQI
jgi:Fe-S cluster biogenesis protein NfuA